MTTPILAPGVRIIEVPPGAPIQGVGTSTAGFIGTSTAGMGQPATPTLVQSWEAFQREFGGGGATRSSRWLARAVYGFFLNGGTACYVVRVSTGATSSVELPSHQTSTTTAPTPEPVLIVVAREEGSQGDQLRVAVAESSLLARRLNETSSTATALTVRGVASDITGVSADRKVLTVTPSDGFTAGDPVEVSKPPMAAVDAVVDAIDGPGTLRLHDPLPDVAPGTYAGGQLRQAKLRQGTRELRVVMPAGLRLADAVPPGAVVLISGPGGPAETHVVGSTATDRLTLTEGITTAFELVDTQPTLVRSLEFDLTITGGQGQTQPETFRWLSTSPDHPRYWLTFVTSRWVRLVEPDAPPAGVDDPRPVVGTGPYRLIDGGNDDPDTAWARIENDPAAALGLLAPVDDVSLVCVPGLTRPDAQQAIIDHCEQVGERFAILDPPANLTVTAIDQHRATLISDRGYAALYYPNIRVRNVATGRNDVQPPSGHIAGVYARTDATRGVHKAPANAGIRGAVELERRLTDAEQGPLNANGINVLRVFGGGGQPLAWGARTINRDASFQYVNVRRLLLFLEESIRRGIGWAVFEPNDLALWQKLRRTISAFLTRVWRDGALFGATADEAFTVQIDAAINSDEDRRNGLLNIIVGVRPVYPAEFVFVRIGLLLGETE